MIETFSKLFNKSSFFAVKKEDALTPELQNLFNQLQFDQSILKFHPNRKEEFLIGRLCASKAYEACFGSPLLNLIAQSDRSPLWPIGCVGTISHDKYWVGAAVAKTSDLIGVGMDFEEMGRTRIELGRQIRSGGDIKTHSDFSEEELLTLIFSCKETLYKALYPSVKKFFGFEDAAVKKIDFVNGIFEIHLLNDLTPNLGPSSRYSFQGRFTVLNKTCLTCLEVSAI